MRHHAHSAERRAIPPLATTSLAVILLLLSLLNGCGSAPEPVPAEQEGFALYLLAGDIKPSDLAALSHLPLRESPLIAEPDVISYSRSSHEIELSPATYEAVRAVSVPLDGRPFAVCVDGAPVYAGAFMTSLWSGSFDGVVIVLPLESAPGGDLHAIQLTLGYPGPDFFAGDDPRSDARVLDSLADSAKLR